MTVIKWSENTPQMSLENIMSDRPAEFHPRHQRVHIKTPLHAMGYHYDQSVERRRWRLSGTVCFGGEWIDWWRDAGMEMILCGCWRNVHHHSSSTAGIFVVNITTVLNLFSPARRAPTPPTPDELMWWVGADFGQMAHAQTWILCSYWLRVTISKKRSWAQPL